MHLIISTLFAVLLFTVTPAWADGGGGITFQRMQEQAERRRAFADDPAAQQRGGPSVIEGEYQRREEDRDRLR